MDFFQLMSRRLNGHERIVPSYLCSKPRTRQFADLIGVHAPALFGSDSIEELLKLPLPDEFVSKPAYASTSIAVKLLQRTGKEWRDLISEEFSSNEELKSQANELSNRYPNMEQQGVFIAEELLRDPDEVTPLADMRFYTFQGLV